MKARSTRPLLGLALALTPGCHTLLQAGHGCGPGVFGGTRLWLDQVGEMIPDRPEVQRALDHPAGAPKPMACMPYLPGPVVGALLIAFGLDLPLSIAADTVLLPVSLVNEAAHGGIYVDHEGRGFKVPRGHAPDADPESQDHGTDSAGE